MRVPVIDRPRIATFLLFGLLALVPVYAGLFDQPFYLTLFARVMIFALAAVSLDLVLGFGGMVSFGHAAYLGVGAYAVGILAYHGVDSVLVRWSVAILASAAVALFIGSVSLRTSGMYFIMITLAFAQMLFYLAVSLKAYGGDDGLPIAQRGAIGPIDLNSSTQLYYLILVLLGLALALAHRIIGSRFGRALEGAKWNERRAVALGIAPYRYRLVAFVISGTICGLAGALLATLTSFVSPSYMAWTRSGEIIVMVVLGGMATLTGPIVGAIVLLVLEEILATITIHWMLILGPVLVLVVLFARRGLWGWIAGARHG
ncbi:MAG: branched-chain amino acid ABC transporter permease [Alphaproteobacteria bacterium]|nr:branched-chain amino acid ABC transporter permease [Alphaproteobacteria bacterium]